VTSASLSTGSDGPSQRCHRDPVNDVPDFAQTVVPRNGPRAETRGPSGVNGGLYKSEVDCGSS